MRALLLAGAILLALNSVALADDASAPAPTTACDPPSRTIAADKAAALTGGLTYLGVKVLPFTHTQAVFYTYDGETLLSLVYEGCVEPGSHDLGAYVAEPDI